MNVDALVMTKPGAIEIVQVETPDPGPDEVQVEIKACGICAWDRHLFHGESMLGMKHPFRFGHEGVGIVHKIGSNVGSFKAGDKVFCSGLDSMTQLFNAKVLKTAHIPGEVDRFEYWIGEPVMCVVNSLDQVKIKPGEKIAVIGVGYMGLLHIQGLVKTLAGNITAFDIDSKKLEMAKEFGADRIVDLSTEEGRRVSDLMGEQKETDTVIETSGTAKGLQLAHHLLKNGGKLSVFGWHGKREIDGNRWILGGLMLLNPSPMSDPHFEERTGQAAVLMRKGVFYQEKLVTHSSPYKHVQELFEYLSGSPKEYIKGAIEF